MEKFTPQKIDLAAINGGNRYGFEGIHPDAINRPIEASAYAQEIAESVKGLALNQPDSSQADIVGTPTVEISGTGENAKFVFKGLKGKQGLTGPSGVASGTVNSNAEGTSDTNGYTQQAVNKIASRPNILINPDFSINQRGKESYTATTVNIYTVDRVLLQKYATPTLTPKTGGGISVSGTSVGAQQFILSYNVEDYAKYAGKTLTLSIKISNVTGTGLRVRTASTDIGNYSATISSDMLYTKTFTVNSNATQLSIILTTGVAGAFSFDIDWWKLEVGSVATTFVPPIYASEIWKCNAVYGEPAPLSNPNLLINPDFSINQRGQTSYNSGGYTFDRWKLYSTGNVVENLSNGYGVKLSAPSTIASQMLLQQKIEININHLLGKTLTISAKIRGYVATNNYYQVVCRCYSTESYGDIIANATIDVTRTGILSASVTVPSNTLSVSVLVRSNGQVSGDYIDIDWIKLEVGSVATAFVPPLRAEELPKCQRYYKIVYGFKRAYDGYGFYEPFQSYGSNMRVSPTILQYSCSASGTIGTTQNGLYNINSSYEVIVSVNPRGYNNEYGCAMQNGDGTLTANNSYRYVLYLDAEIY